MIHNITRHTTICRNEKVLSGIFSKALGLMFSKEIKDIGYIFIFQTTLKVNLHMFFVFFPIDILFLDEDKRVVEVKHNLKPFRIYNSKIKAKFVIELPVNTIMKSNTKNQDILSW